MTIEQAVLEKIKVLPINRQQEVLEFAEFLESKKEKRRNVKEFRIKSKRMGFRKDLNYDKTSELIEIIEGVEK